MAQRIRKYHSSIGGLCKKKGEDYEIWTAVVYTCNET